MSSLGSVTQGAVGTSQIIPIASSNQLRTAPPNIGMVAAISAGANLTYSVQLTCDANPTDNGNWVNHDVLTGLSASKYGNIAYAVTGVRLNVTAWAAGTVNLALAQWP